MTVQLTPYLAFRSETREAFDFYASVFGGSPTFSTFGEFGVGTPGEAEKVMHAQLATPSGLLLMGADRPDSYPLEEASSVSLSLFGGPDDAETLTGWFDALAEGGTVHEALSQAPWGDSFGMLDDRFGQHWMVNVGGAAA
ncbi:VOC family protein [Frigoribacterium sp. ME-P-080]|uniref:VOC family protein n=1 Tax=Frigoribacterium sp. ME-P-080 TaxID=3040289 RepID=UPI0025515113|nr:VOC family protein [Frigoribacterium sp. ME-P-080]